MQYPTCTYLNRLLNKTYIQQVIVNGLDAEFELRNYLEQVVPQEDAHNVSIDNYNDFYKAAMVASDEGELIIKVPDLESSPHSLDLLKGNDHPHIT
jgi:hypothetical protein